MTAHDPAHARDAAEPSPPRTSAARSGASAAIVATAGRARAAAFAALSRLRHRRVFHPYGASFTGTLTVEGRSPRFGVSLLDTQAEHECIVRFSRGLGLREPFPDILGMAVRIALPGTVDRTQDLLLVTAGEGPLGRHVFVPSARYTARHSSSLVPYRVAGTTDIQAVGLLNALRRRTYPASQAARLAAGAGR